MNDSDVRNFNKVGNVMAQNDIQWPKMALEDIILFIW